MSDLSGAAGAADAEPLEVLAEALRRAIGASAGPSGTLLWAATPTALLDHASAGAPRAGRHRLPDAARTLASGVAGARGSVLTMVDDVLFAYEGANPAATLEPVIEAFAQARGTRPVPHSVRPSIGSLVRGLRDVRRAEAAARDALGAALPEALTRALQAAIRARGRAAAALDALRPTLVVVASQHSTSSRAVIHAAAERAIPTAYLPHAPAADTYQYRDLPTDFAGLRGDREVEFYRGLGAVRDPATVGNPQAHVEAPAVLDPSGPIVFAPRPQAPELVRQQVADLAAVAAEVVVSPHPRMKGKARYEGLWPTHWEVHDGWTAELLRRGHPCVVQMSSGVAWEAMAHGVPVIELASATGAAPSYLVIREPFVRVCAERDDLGRAIADARAAAADPAARQRLMAWAQEWCIATGPEAVARATQWIEACAAAPRPSGPLLDHWGMGRVAT